MFKPLLIISSLPLSLVFDPVEKQGVPDREIYISTHTSDPVVPKWKSTFSNQPESTHQWIQENIEKQMYKPTIEELER
jgi:hypothetical protein